MKKNFLLMLTAVITATVSCKKDKTAAPEQPSSIEGYWAGKYNNDPAQGLAYTDNYAMLIKKNGVLRVYDLGTNTDTALISEKEKVSGTWKLNGTILQTSYKSAAKTVNTKSTINAAFTSMEGVWGFGDFTNGSFYLEK